MITRENLAHAPQGEVEAMEETVELEWEETVLEAEGLDAEAMDTRTTTQAEIQMIALADIQVCRGQARKTFDATALGELAGSMHRYGLLQPILVRRLQRKAGSTAPRYELVAGERRWRAAQTLDWTHIQGISQDYSAETASEVNLVENIQRDDLSALEAGKALKRLCEHRHQSYAGLAKRVGKSKGWVEDRLRIANTSSDLQDMVVRRPDTLTHVRELERVVDPKQRKALIQEVQGKLTVADLRRRIQKLDSSAQDSETSGEETSPVESGPAEAVTGHDNKDNEADMDGEASSPDDAAKTLDAMVEPLAPPLAASMVAASSAFDMEVAAFPISESRQQQETTRESVCDVAGNTQCYENLLADVRDLQRAVMSISKPPTEELRQRIMAELDELMEIICKLEDRWKAAA